MGIRQACGSMILMASGLLSFPGCSLWTADTNNRSMQYESILEGESKALAGRYQDVGSDGSIKPHPEFSHTVSPDQYDQRTTDTITLGTPSSDSNKMQKSESILEGPPGNLSRPDSKRTNSSHGTPVQ